jgi:hypothetical protein
LWQSSRFLIAPLDGCRNAAIGVDDWEQRHHDMLEGGGQNIANNKQARARLHTSLRMIN